MRAICLRRVGALEKGETVNYIVSDNRYVVNNSISLNRMSFLYHFKVIEGNERMKYSDFEYILCNHVFTMSVLFPQEYSGIRHLIIQSWDSVLITINKEEDVIRVSFKNGQEIYSSYEDALDGIINHKYDE